MLAAGIHREPIRIPGSRNHFGQRTRSGVDHNNSIDAAARSEERLAIDAQCQSGRSNAPDLYTKCLQCNGSRHDTALGINDGDCIAVAICDKKAVARLIPDHRRRMKVHRDRVRCLASDQINAGERAR